MELAQGTQEFNQLQLDKLKGLLGATLSGIDFNNLVPQPLNRRVVAEMSKDAGANPINNILHRWLRISGCMPRRATPRPMPRFGPRAVAY